MKCFKLLDVVSSIYESSEQPQKYVFIFGHYSWEREDQNIIITF